MAIDGGVKVRDARADYFRRHGLGADGGYDASLAVFPLGAFRLRLPNPAARRRALPLHDLTHIATGYDTSWTGESEIAAWELASGCGSYAAVWVLSAVAFTIGLVIAPRRVWRAFRRGRVCASLYHESWNEQWLDLTVDELRQQLKLDRSPDNRVRSADVLLFAACTLPLGLILAGVASLALTLWRLSHSG